MELSEEEKRKRMPTPPEFLVNALQDSLPDLRTSKRSRAPKIAKRRLMKRYLLFGGVKDYTDQGGWQDYLTDEDSLDKAIETLKALVTDSEGMSGEITWAHIVDTDSEEIVKRFSK